MRGETIYEGSYDLDDVGARFARSAERTSEIESTTELRGGLLHDSENASEHTRERRGTSERQW